MRLNYIGNGILISFNIICLHMKKLRLPAIFLLLFLPTVSDADIYLLKLRTNHHPDFLRIVLEGHKSIISKGHVYQRGKNIVAAFPGTGFSIQDGNNVIPYRKTDNETLIFSPKDFRGLKVFKLEHPDRLVIDVYAKRKKAKGAFPWFSGPESERKAEIQRIETVVIDPGHGGYESGLSKGDFKEKNIALDIGKKFRLLINSGHSKGFLTRGSDRFMKLSERVKFANSKNIDIFLSLHVGSESGITIYVPVITRRLPDVIRPYLYNRGQADYMEDTALLLDAMKDAMISQFGDNMITVRPIPYGIISQIEGPALLIELPSFEDTYYSEEFKSKIAKTLYRGIYMYEEIKAK